MRCTWIALLLVTGVCLAQEIQKDSIMKFPAGSIVMEGENAVSTNFVADFVNAPHTARVDSQVKPLFFPAMSGGKASMLCTKKKTPKVPYSAVYKFESAKAGQYVLWVFEQGRTWASPFRWRLDNGEWNDVSIQKKMLKTTPMGKGGPTFAWVRLGPTGKVKAGKHQLTVEVTGTRQDSSYLLSQDFFLLMPLDGSSEKWPFDGGFEQPAPNALYLWKNTPSGSAFDDGYPPWLEPFMLKGDSAKGAVIICPGGGYRGLASAEGNNVAAKFNEFGYHAYVLHYRVTPNQYPSQLMDVSRAVRLVRHNAAAFKVKPDRIALCGFSAGGHLSASLGVHFERVPPSDDKALDSVSCRPDALILCYPGISMFGDYGKKAWQMGIMPDSASLGTKKMLSTELFVTKKTPPSFLWHCFDDWVDVRNSLVFATALREKEVPCEMHIYPKGGHGLDLAEKDPHIGTWTMLCDQWLKSMNW